MSECIELYKLTSNREKHPLPSSGIGCLAPGYLITGKNGKPKPENTGGHSQEKNRHKISLGCRCLSFHFNNLNVYLCFTINYLKSFWNVDRRRMTNKYGKPNRLAKQFPKLKQFQDKCVN